MRLDDPRADPHRPSRLLTFVAHEHGREDSLCAGRALPGTYFWHDHASANRADGLQGPLIVLPAKGATPPGTPHYDSEETIFIQDWFHAQGSVLAFHLGRCAA